MPDLQAVIAESGKQHILRTSKVWRDKEWHVSFCGFFPSALEWEHLDFYEQTSEVNDPCKVCVKSYRTWIREFGGVIDLELEFGNSDGFQRNKVSHE